MPGSTKKKAAVAAPAPGPSQEPVFEHPLYVLEDNDRLVRRLGGGGGGAPPSHEEHESLVEALAKYVKAHLQARFGLVQHWIPADDATARCDILVSPDWDSAQTLLVVLQNHVGAQMGIWSRSTCLHEGLQAGSMLPFLERARAQGYAVIVCNANLNSVVRKGRGKVPIRDSAFPEEHAMYVYDNLVAQSKARHVLLFGYGNGAALCKEMLQRQLVRSRQQPREGNRIAGIATVEASVLIQEDDSADVKAFLGRFAIDWESSPTLPPGHTIAKTRAQLGVSQALSVGCPATPSSTDQQHQHQHHPPSTAWSLGAALDSVFRFFAFALEQQQQQQQQQATGVGTASAPAPPASPMASTSPTPHGGSEEDGNLGYRFAVEEAAHVGVSAPAAPTPRRLDDPAMAKTLLLGSPSLSGAGESSPRASPRGGSPRGGSPRSPRMEGLLSRWRRMFSSSSPGGSDSGSGGGVGGSGFGFAFSLGSPRRSPRGRDSPRDGLQRASSGRAEGGGCRSMALTERLGIADFDLLKVVGKGAFGKVMLVRKKGGPGAGHVYAMKVLSKEAVVRKGQIQHTLSERAILCEIRHPFIVRLRFAFQSEASLYLVTDFYTGGSLFYHLRKAQAFPEARAKFYAAELLLALEHLHRNFVIYRDLKLENVLMDAHGHVALTDFGLSKQDVRSQAGATTFCGTAEYLAPELLRGKPYGAPVDWWSFGVLLYEMLDGRTPFYNKNRKHMFHCIVHVRPTFPPHFSKPAKHLIFRLLEPDPARRFGSGEKGAKEIMEHDFFSDIDFERLYQRELTPPFNPKVKSAADMKFVPSTYQKMPPKESHTEPTGAGRCAAAAHEFKAFTYTGDGSHLT